jgi:hypothetical protein
MPKLPKDELERIVERDAPGHMLAPTPEAQDERATRAEPEESSPDIAALREKYLGETAAPEAEAPTDAGDAGEEPDDEIVPVQRTDAADPFDHESRPKTIVVSGKDKKIIGSQG